MTISSGGTEVLIDSNVLIDAVRRGSPWHEWAVQQLSSLGERCILVINPFIYSEISIGFSAIEHVDEAFPDTLYRRDALPWSAAFLAGRLFLRVSPSRRQAHCATSRLLHRRSCCRSRHDSADP